MEMVSKCSECDIHLLADRASLPGQSGRPEKPVSGRVLTVDTSDADAFCEEILAVVIPQMGWKEVKTRPKDHACDITWFPYEFDAKIKSGQVNDFPGSNLVCEKIHLFRWLLLMQSVFPEDYNFMPDTWLLPEEMDIFTNHVNQGSSTSPVQSPVRAHEARWLPARAGKSAPSGASVEMTKNNASNDDKSAYIVKPTDGYSAKGVYLLQQPDEYVASQNGDIVQEYISDPLLMDGFKVDIRLHVYVHSLFPLSLYICREGYIRLATVPYQKPSKENMAESCMHITNYSFNIFHDNFDKSEDDHHGSLRRLSVVFKTMEEQGHDIPALWAKIDHLVTRTVQAIAGQIRVDTVAAGCEGEEGPTCRQLMGFDIMLDGDLEPILVEANHYTGLGITEERQLPDGSMEIYVSRKLLHVSRVFLRDSFTLMAAGEDRAKVKNPAQEKDLNILTAKADYPNSADNNIENSKNGNKTKENCQTFQKELEKIRELNADKDFTLTPPAANQSGGFNSPSVLEPLSDLFTQIVGGTGHQRVDLEAFQSFVQKSGLSQKGVDSSAAKEIYSRLSQLYSNSNLNNNKGLNFFGFVSVCCELAATYFDGTCRSQILADFTEFCLHHMTPTTNGVECIENKTNSNNMMQ